MNLQISQTIIALAFIHVVVSFVVLFATPMKIKQVGEYMKLSVSNRALWGVSLVVVLTIGILAIIEYQNLEKESFNMDAEIETSEIQTEESD